MDLFAAFGPHAQEALDFISDPQNQTKLKQYLSSGQDTAQAILVSNERTVEETQIRIAVDGNKFLTKEEWNEGKYSKDDVIGIAVITPCVQFILGLHQWQARWSEDTDHCHTDNHSESQALQIISGLKHTKAIVDAQEEEGDTAAKMCWNYGHKGLQWYLPCLLELCAVCANKEEINELLKLVGGDLLDFEECYWSSTEYSANIAWHVGFSNGYCYNYIKYNAFVVRPAVAI